MKIYKAVMNGHLPRGMTVWLTDAQASARAHKITETKGGKKSERKLYVALGQLGFKTGEEVGLDGELDSALRRLFGVTFDAGGTRGRKKPDDVPDAADVRAKALAAAKARLDAAIEAEADAQKAHETLATDVTATPEDIRAAADALAKAGEAVDQAKAELEKLEAGG
jgi:hypothetical protein